VRVASFRPGVDEAAWVEANARAFASHPEQGRLTFADLADRAAQPWFDPAGFLLAWRPGPPARLVGFHWTKVHPATGGRPPHGEVYVLGIDPAEQGHGLGRLLTLVGLHHLRDRYRHQGLAEVLLYVEGDNAAALRTYAGLGFVRRGADVRYARDRTVAG
jgi:mycothiol synthase